jgi:lysophospholipase L1-like esterase
LPFATYDGAVAVYEGGWRTFIANLVLRRPFKVIFGVALSISVAVLVVTFLRQEACGAACVVLIGDSITANWQGSASDKELAGLRIVNRGAPGDVTAHMLSRFNHDVIGLRPRVVVIQGGINDFARVPLSSTEKNLEAMAEKAQGNGIVVVLATLPPTGKPDSDITASAQDSGHEKIRALNDWIKELAARKHFVLVDYHSVLADERGSYLEGFTLDGIHPSARGYARMEPLLRDAVQAAVRGGT